MVTKKLVDLKKGVEKVKATITDEELEDLYDRIIHRKGDVYAGSPYIGGRLRDLDIKKYVKNGLSRKEAILKIASEGNHEIILGLPFNPTLDDALKAVKRKMGSKIIDTLELKRQKQKQEGKLKRQKQEEYIMKYASDLYAKYQKKYPHNPLGVLELHINRKMKRGLIREEAIKELQEEVM